MNAEHAAGAVSDVEVAVRRLPSGGVDAYVPMDDEHEGAGSDMGAVAQLSRAMEDYAGDVCRRLGTCSSRFRRGLSALCTSARDVGEAAHGTAKDVGEAAYDGQGRR